MKERDFLSELKVRGVKVKHGTNHYRLECRGKNSVLPRHPSKELSDYLCRRVLKQLELL